MPDDRVSASAMEAYLGRVHALMVAASGTVPAEQLQQAHRLIEHGEPAEGMLYLAWAVTNGNYRIPRWVVDGIRDTTVGMVQTELPPDLDQHIC